MACTSERRAEIAELAGGRLGATAAAGLLEHVHACAECSAELDLVADLLHAPPAPALARPRRLDPRWIGGLVALAAAAVLLAVLLLRSPPRRLHELAHLAPPPQAGHVLRGADGAAGTDELARAAELFSAGEYARAGEAFRALLEARPDDPLVLFYLGLARLQTGEHEQALEALERAEELGTGLLAEQALWYRAQAHLACDEGAEARTLLRRLVELDGDYEPNARAQLAELEPLLER